MEPVDVSRLLADQWRQHFVAYEDALATFYALQDATQTTLEQSYALTSHRRRLESLRKSILAVKRELPQAADDRRVVEIEREQATIDLDGVPFPVMELVANRAAHGDAVLELSFNVDPKAIPQFVKLTEPIRIKFPFGESTFVASCRLVRFRLVRNQFAFRFATVDPA
jgi:hypothetical protein